MKPDRSEFQELNKHVGVENYEIISLFDDKFEMGKPQFDSQKEQLVVYGKTKPLLEKDFLSQRIMVSILGDSIDNGITMRKLRPMALSMALIFIQTGSSTAIRPNTSI